MDNKNNLNNSNQKKSKENFDIPVEGSLGLLALGAVGLKAWRKKRDEEESKSNNKKV